MKQNGIPPCILFLCDYQAPYGGNFIASMVRLSEALSKKQVKSLYVFPQGAGDRVWCRRMEELGLSVHFFPSGNDSARLRFLLQLIDREGVTILHAHFGFFPLAEAAAWKRRKLRLILHFHSDFSAGKQPGFAARLREGCKGILEWCIGKRRITKITVSECSARTTRDCISVHNALVESRFTADCWSREQTRRSCGIPESAVLLLVFGWSPYIKGVDIAGKAVAALRETTGVDYRLGIVCGRTYIKEKMAAFLRERAGLTGEEHWLVYLPPEEDVFRYHLAADLMLSPSRSETFSYALLEAVATARPVAASDIPGQQWARQFSTVGFFPTEDVNALAEAIPLALEASREALAASALQAKSDFAIAGWVQALLDIYGV